MENFYPLIENIVSKYPTNEIFIIGKGSSIDEVETRFIKNSVIINLNDSEKIVPGNFCFFHKPWVLKSLSSSSLKCDLYFSDYNYLEPSNEKLIKLPFYSYNLDNIDMLLFRFLEDNIEVDEFLFVSAIKLTKLIGRRRRKTQKVYMLGFDFASEKQIYSSKLQNDFSKDDESFKKSFIRNQEFVLLELMNLLKEKKELYVDLIHVGNKAYSKVSIAQFNQYIRHRKIITADITAETNSKDQHAPFLTDHKEINDSEVLIVAEFTNNHLGDLGRLKDMIYLAEDGGADLVKVQKRDVKSFYSIEQLNSPYYSPFGTTLGDYRNGVELNEKAFQILDEVCAKSNIKWFSSVLDYNSYLFIKRFSPPIIKIPSTISEDSYLHQKIAEDFNGGIVISTGFTLPDYEESVINLFKNFKQIFLLHTISAYPTPVYDCNIGIVRHYRDLAKKYPNIIPGYSSHDIGSLGSMLAVASGAKMIEKHVKLGNTDWIHFDNVAVDLNHDFKQFVADIRLAEAMCGQEIKDIVSSEDHKYWK